MALAPSAVTCWPLPPPSFSPPQEFSTPGFFSSPFLPTRVLAGGGSHKQREGRGLSKSFFSPAVLFQAKPFIPFLPPPLPFFSPNGFLTIGEEREERERGRGREEGRGRSGSGAQKGDEWRGRAKHNTCSKFLLAKKKNIFADLFGGGPAVFSSRSFDDDKAREKTLPGSSSTVQ